MAYVPATQGALPCYLQYRHVGITTVQFQYRLVCYHTAVVSSLSRIQTDDKHFNAHKGHHCMQATLAVNQVT